MSDAAVRIPAGPAQASDGRSFWGGSNGRWAGEQMLKALQSGRQLSGKVLRTLDTLRKDEWIELDEALVRAARIRLRGVADLMAAGLVKRISNGMGKTVMQWETVGDMQPAQVSMDGVTRTEMDRPEFGLTGLPLPITHKDWYLNLRTLAASRERGESLDTTASERAGRVIAEKVEDMLFNGYGKTFAGLPIYGYTTHPNRNTTGFGTHGAWSASAKTGEDILADVLTLIGLLEADRMFGPYWLYVPSNTSVKLENDFKTNSDKSVRSRLLEVDRLAAIHVADTLAADNIVLVQATPDVVQLIEGEPLQTIQWDVEGGFWINFKAFTIQVPLIRADESGHCGVAHMS